MPLALLPTTSLLRETKARDEKRHERNQSTLWFVLVAFVFVAFVGVVIVLVGSMFVRVNHLIDRVSNADVTARVDELLDLAVTAAANTQRATVEIAAAATLAHEMAVETRPQMTHVLNTTHELVDSAKSFAFHPKLVIGT